MMHQVINAYRSATGGGGVTAKYAYTEDNSTITESAGSFTDLLSYTSSGLTNGKTHLGIWTCEGVVNSTSPTIETLLQIDGVDGLTEIRKSKSSGNVFSFGGLFLHTPAGSSTSTSSSGRSDIGETWRRRYPVCGTRHND